MNTLSLNSQLSKINVTTIITLTANNHIFSRMAREIITLYNQTCILSIYRW